MVLSISSCQNESNGNVDVTVEKDSISAQEVNDSFIQTIETNQRDTFYFGSQQILIAPLEDTSCFHPVNDFNWRNSDLEAVKQDTSVHRIGDSLIFTLHNQDTVVLKSDAAEGDSWSDFGFNYYFVQNLSDIQQWEVFAMGYECHNTLLIDQRTGRKVKTVGSVSVSPNFEYVATYNADQEAGYTTNHITLYQNTGKRLKELVLMDLDRKDWAPYNIVWTSNNTLLIKQGRFVEEGYHIEYSCAEAVISDIQ